MYDYVKMIMYSIMYNYNGLRNTFKKIFLNVTQVVKHPSAKKEKNERERERKKWKNGCFSKLIKCF